MKPGVDADVVVVGVGSAGSAALWRLALRGARVIGIEQFQPGHDRGSGHGESRIIRTAYHEHPAYVPLVRSAWQLWRSLEAATRTTLLTRTGAVMIGPSDGGLLTGALAAARAHELAYELLDADTCRGRFPQHVLDPGEAAITEPDAGFLRPELAIRTMSSAAAAHGGTLVTAERVKAIEPVGGGVRVVVDRRAFTARHVVVCAGAWVGDVLPALGIPLQVERQVQAWFPVRDASRYGPERFPVFIRQREGHFVYGIPSPDGRTVKAGVHHEGQITNPGVIDRSIGDSDVTVLGALIEKMLPGVVPVPSRATVCMYTNTPDGHFAVGAVPGLDKVTVVSACSGHGFKFAPVLGEIAADLALHGGTEYPIDLFDPRRLL
jgi:sarcosine oxidase